MFDNEFENAQELKKLNPETFEAPTLDELSNVREGDNVKVCTGGERFWVEVKLIEDNTIYGKVNNRLVNFYEHGLDLGDVVRFDKECIYDIFNKED